MGFIEWTGALSVGIDAIDSQHKVLVGLINRLDEARVAGSGREALEPILHELAEYTRKHFSFEEKAFVEGSYPEARAHKAEHDAFVARLSSLEEAWAAGEDRIDAELLAFLKTWLTRHIAYSDRKYKPWVAALSRDSAP